MPNELALGTLRIHACRGGTVHEICSFLEDLEKSYLALYQLNLGFNGDRHSWAYPFFQLNGLPTQVFHDATLILPEHRLVVQKIVIQSPGFWEFVAALNPLSQIREYLNEHHKRRQDKDYREQAESVRLRLENDLIQEKIIHDRNENLRGRIDILKYLGYNDAQIRQLMWSKYGQPLSRLGHHQDIGLIEIAESCDQNGPQDTNQSTQN